MIDKKNDVPALAELLCNLSLIEASQLADMLKEKLNIQDVPMNIAAAAPVNSCSEDEDEQSSGKKEFSLILKSFDSTKKAKAIKALRDIKKKEGSDIGVKEAKDLVESAPIKVCENIPEEKAAEYISLFKEAGAEAQTE